MSHCVIIGYRIMLHPCSALGKAGDNGVVDHERNTFRDFLQSQGWRIQKACLSLEEQHQKGLLDSGDRSFHTRTR
jgi:hypothetical protein